MKVVRLPDALAPLLAAGHPWIYRDRLGAVDLPSGTWVKIQSASYEAYGLWDAESAIAIRLYSTRGIPDAAWVRERVDEAYRLREEVRARGVTGYRLIYGEADQLAGIVVDVYGPVAVLVTYSKSVQHLSEEVARAVGELPGIETVVRRLRRDDGVELVPLLGPPPPRSVVIDEGGRMLLAELYSGQKTGLFFDHRDNRDYVASRARGKTVLNLFAYTGGFSVAAALGGAAAVTSVDIAEPAVRAAVENFRLNELETPHEAIAADVFAYLEQAERKKLRFDLVVCDPPSFAKNRAQLDAAEKAYTKLLSACLRIVSPGGVLCAASCTSQVGPAHFRELLAASVRKARVRFQILRDVGHAPDHPVLVAHEEGRYLKFVAGRVLPRC